MPVWLHQKTSKVATRIYKTDGAKCLRNKHRTHYVGQLAELIGSVPAEHRETNFCTCGACRKASGLGCTHPQKCLETAKGLIEALAPKWRPEVSRRQRDNPPAAPTRTREDRGDGIVVKTTRQATDLKRSIRIFTERRSMLEATALGTTEDVTQETTELVIYTDGSCSGIGMDGAKAGSGLWYGTSDPRNMAIRVPGKHQSNQIGELLAIQHAIKATPGNRPLRIKSDSRFAIDGLTKYALDWEAKDWIGISLGPLFKCTTAWLRARTATTVLQWVKGHAGIEGNDGADRLAAEGAQKNPDRSEIDLRIPADTMTSGAELARTSQSLIYRHLTNSGDITRKASRRSVEKIKMAVEGVFGDPPTEEAIWKSMRHKDVTKKVRDFLWRHVHGIYRLGSFWNHIPGCESRAVCPLCNKYDTFEHIVTECDSAERKTVWAQADSLWKRRYSKGLPVSEGAVLGGGLTSFRRSDGKLDTAKNRLYRILVTESAHLIWVLRCERRIANGDTPQDYHTEETVRNR